MNNVCLMGRLTAEPEVRWSMSNGNNTAVGKFTLAVDRRIKKEGAQNADFIRCVAFGKIGEFAEKYLHKGTKIVVSGRIQTGSYTNDNNQKVYTTDVIVESCEFAESKKNDSSAPAQPQGDQFINVPEGLEEELPFA